MARQYIRYLAEQLTLKVTLLGSNPKIWRRVEVHSDLTLHDLHYVMQNLFEWTDCHLYHFYTTPDDKLTYKARREAVYYQSPDFADDFGEENTRKADDTLLASIFTDGRKQIVYEYDMGDSWQHLVKLEKRKPGGDMDHIPQCLAGENAAPLDDMGGIWGYYDYLDALQDRSHEMHEQAVEWLGRKFDPLKFDLKEVNWRLNKCFKPAAKKPRKNG